MSQIYDLNLWGGRAFDFYSGDGSHNHEIINPYLKALIAFFKAHNSSLVICDLGCGDFNIGKNLVGYSSKYIAVDIVEQLINRNKKLYKASNLEFHSLDIANDALPFGDCVILRQVLQHLSNKEIQNIVKKIACYRYVILTEHIPLGEFVPNKDIISGQGIRLKKHSGVNIVAPPFNLKIKTMHELHVYVLKDNKGQIVTRLYELF